MLHFKKFISVSGEFKGWAEQAYLGNLTGKLRFTWAACRQLWIARLLAESVCCQMCPLSQICAPTCAVSGLFTCHAKEPSYNIQRAELKPSDKTFLTQWKLFTAATVRTFHNVFFFFFFKSFCAPLSRPSLFDQRKGASSSRRTEWEHICDGWKPFYIGKYLQKWTQPQ